MAPLQRPINLPILTQAEFHNERCRIYHFEWDTGDMETNTEGPFTPYHPSREDLDEWLAHWRALYPGKVPSERPNHAQARVANAEKTVLAREEKGEEVIDGSQRGGKGEETNVLGAFCTEKEGNDNGVGKVGSHSEGLRALEEGLGERMGHGIKRLARMLRR